MPENKRKRARCETRALAGFHLSVDVDASPHRSSGSTMSKPAAMSLRLGIGSLDLQNIDRALVTDAEAVSVLDVHVVLVAELEKRRQSAGTLGTRTAMTGVTVAR